MTHAGCAKRSAMCAHYSPTPHSGRRSKPEQRSKGGHSAAQQARSTHCTWRMAAATCVSSFLICGRGEEDPAGRVQCLCKAALRQHACLHKAALGRCMCLPDTAARAPARHPRPAPAQATRLQPHQWPRYPVPLQRKGHPTTTHLVALVQHQVPPAHRVAQRGAPVGAAHMGQRRATCRRRWKAAHPRGLQRSLPT